MAHTNPHEWLLEPLVEDPGFITKPMFGCLAGYLRGQLVLVLAAKDEPWSGVLWPVERSEHLSIQEEYPSLVPHPVLPKWLYLSEQDEDFEELATAIVEQIRCGDARLGVVPPVKKKKSKG